MNRKIAALSLAVLIATVMPVCTGSKHLDGPRQSLGRGQAWSWTEFDTDGNLVRLGVTMTQNALIGLPTSYDEVELPLPGTEMPTPPYHSVVLGWDPLGHTPDAYSVPHFDFMFFFVSSEELGRISPGSDTIPVPANFRPRDYNAALAEPSVGTHWGDTLARELHGQPFTATFVYGFQDGKMIFLEPMVALSFLGKPSPFTGEVKQPQAFQREGYYPSRYLVTHNDKDSTVTIALEGLTLQKAANQEPEPRQKIDTVPADSVW
jgi:hypothetical protein